MIRVDSALWALPRNLSKATFRDSRNDLMSPERNHERQLESALKRKR